MIGDRIMYNRVVNRHDKESVKSMYNRVVNRHDRGQNHVQ